MFVQIKETHPENNNLQELALCSGESHFDGRRVILQRQLSHWKGEGDSYSSLSVVTRWVPHSHCSLLELAWLRWHHQMTVCDSPALGG